MLNLAVSIANTVLQRLITPAVNNRSSTGVLMLGLVSNVDGCQENLNMALLPTGHGRVSLKSGKRDSMYSEHVLSEQGIPKIRLEGNVKIYFNRLTLNDTYSGRTAPLTSKGCILYMYSTNIDTEYFKQDIYSRFFSLQNASCFIILMYLVPVLFTFYIQVC